LEALDGRAVSPDAACLAQRINDRIDNEIMTDKINWWGYLDGYSPEQLFRLQYLGRLPVGQLREQLASYAHAARSGWMRYLFEKSTKNPDGTVTIPKWAVDRWERQMMTDYSQLEGSEQTSDRTEADRMIQIMEEYGYAVKENPASETGWDVSEGSGRPSTG
jgi:hypothetical protein